MKAAIESVYEGGCSKIGEYGNAPEGRVGVFTDNDGNALGFCISEGKGVEIFTINR